MAVRIARLMIVGTTYARHKDREQGVLNASLEPMMHRTQHHWDPRLWEAPHRGWFADHNTTDIMGRSQHIRSAVFLLLGCFTTLLYGQDQPGVDPHGGFEDNRIVFHEFKVLGDPAGCCGGTRFYTAASWCELVDHPEITDGTEIRRAHV